jgi:hypothetical protein
MINKLSDTFGTSSYKNFIMRNSAFNISATIAIGIPSVLVLYVANIILSKDDLTNFIKVWALSNTLIVGVTSPLFTFAPNLRMGFKDAAQEFDECYFLVSFLICSLFIIPVEFIVIRWIFQIDNFSVFLSFAIFTLFSISFNIRSSALIALGSYGKYFLGATVFGLSSSLALIFLATQDFQSLPTLTYIFAFAFGIASIDFVFQSIKMFSWKSMQKFLSRIREMQTTVSFLITIFITSTSTFILNGPLLIGSHIDASSVQLITFGTFLNIGLICFTILNSFTSPIQTALISALKIANYKQFKIIYRKSFNSYLLLSIVLTLGLTFTLNSLAYIYVSSVGHQNLITRFVLVAGLGFSTLSGLPRLGLMISNSYLLLSKIWLAGLLSFVLVIFLPIDSFSAMVFAPTIANGLILISCHVFFKMQIEELSDASPSA